MKALSHKNSVSMGLGGLFIISIIYTVYIAVYLDIYLYVGLGILLKGNKYHDAIAC